MDAVYVVVCMCVCEVVACYSVTVTAEEHQSPLLIVVIDDSYVENGVYISLPQLLLFSFVSCFVIAYLLDCFTEYAINILFQIIIYYLLP